MFVIKTSFEFIVEVTGPIIILINNKYVINQDLKHACEPSNNSLPYSSKWVGKYAHEKITKDRVGCGEFTGMVTVTKNHLHCQNKLGSVLKGFF